MSRQNRKRVSAQKVKKFWASKLVELEKFDSIHEVMETSISDEDGEERHYCFACGKMSDVERAHILARCEGGSDGVENLHLLCHYCHVLSELLSGDHYWRWFSRMSMLAWISPSELEQVLNVIDDGAPKHLKTLIAQFRRTLKKDIGDVLDRGLMLRPRSNSKKDITSL